MKSVPEGTDARGDAEERRGRHRLRPRRRGRREREAGPAADPRRLEARVDLLDRVRGPVGSEVSVGRQAAAAGRQLRAQPQGHQRGGLPGLLPARRASSFRASWTSRCRRPPLPYDPAKAKQLLAEAGYPKGIDAGEFVPTPPFITVAEAALNDLSAIGIRLKMRTMERAAFLAAWREKKLRGLFLVAVGNSGNAASRVEAFIYSKGSYAYGGYPDIDDLFQQQGRERDVGQARGLAPPDPAAHHRPGDVRAGHGLSNAARRRAPPGRACARLDAPGAVPRSRGHAAQESIAARPAFPPWTRGGPEEARAMLSTRRQRASDSRRPRHPDGRDDAPVLDPGAARLGAAGARLRPGARQAARRGAGGLPRHAGAGSGCSRSTARTGWRRSSSAATRNAVCAASTTAGSSTSTAGAST